MPAGIDTADLRWQNLGAITSSDVLNPTGGGTRSMPQRLNTVIVVPHSQAKFFKFSFSTRALILTAAGCALAILLSVLAISFTCGAITHRGDGIAVPSIARGSSTAGPSRASSGGIAGVARSSG